ncbi:MAG: hypothetical protein KAR55_02540 [Thermoplasmatales archaeon]|nr:hypothetical protein [Thermoplasmatales archaeon]
MKERKSKFIVFAISIVVILVLSSFNSLGSSTKLNVVYDKSTSNSSVVSLQATISTSTIKISEIYGLNDIPFNNSKNIVVTNKARNESYPSVVTGSYRALASFEVEDEEGKSRIYFRNSGNYGQSWSSNEDKLVAKLNDANPDIEVEHPTLSVSPKSPYNAYAAFVSPFNDSGVNGYLITPNVGADLENTDISIIDWSVYDFYDFEHPDIVAFDNSITPWVFVQIGSTDYVDPNSGLGPCKNSLMFVFNTLDDPNSVTTAWFPEFENCSNVSIANHFGDDTIYGVCEQQNGSRKDLLFFKGNPESWVGDEEDLENLSFWFPTVNLSHPQIFVRNDDIYIVATLAGLIGGEFNQAIGIIYSSDGGETWDITSPVDDILFPPNATTPTFPDIKVNDTQMYVTFIEDNNLYFTNSSTASESWSDPIKINDVDDSVVEDYRFAEIGSMDHIVWTDNRDGNKDIYSALRAAPEIDLLIVPGSINLSTEGYNFFQAKNWIEFAVKNDGGQFVENVPIEITYKRFGSDPVKTEYQSILTYLNVGAEKTIERPLFRLTVIEFINALIDFAGIQNITVTVDPDDSLGDNDFSNNAYTLTNVTYGTIFPRLAWLEDIL